MSFGSTDALPFGIFQLTDLQLCITPKHERDFVFLGGKMCKRWRGKILVDYNVLDGKLKILTTATIICYALAAPNIHSKNHAVH